MKKGNATQPAAQFLRGKPIGIADSCVVRHTEILPDPLLLTTDPDFKMDRRLGRRVIPTRMP